MGAALGVEDGVGTEPGVVDTGEMGESLEGGDGAWDGGDMSVGSAEEPWVGVSVWDEVTVRGGVNISSGGTQTVMLGGSSGSSCGFSSGGTGGWRTAAGTSACATSSAFCPTPLCLRGGVMG